jgi:hypothetical protein
MMFVTLVCVVLGLSTIAPGLGIPLGIVLIGVWTRTVAVTRARAARGLTVTTPEKLQLFASSLGVTLGLLGLVAVAGFAAFWAVCFACIGTYAGVEAAVDENTAMLMAWTACGAAALAILFVTFKWAIPSMRRFVRRRWRRDIGEASDAGERSSRTFFFVLCILIALVVLWWLMERFVGW